MIVFRKYFALLVCAVLLIAYLWLNWTKVMIMVEGLWLFSSADKLQTLYVKNKGQTISRYDLPTSDLFDRSGLRQLNFRYVSKAELAALRSKIKGSRFWINDQQLENVKIEYRTRSLALLMPEHKLYILAPPHTQQFAAIVEYERKNRSDVMGCRGSADFCESVKIDALGAVSSLKNRILKEDTIGSYFAPMGRWVSSEMDVRLLSNKVREVILTATMSVPFEQQGIRVKDPQKAVYRIIKNGPRPSDDLRYMAPFVFQIKLPLNQGETILRVLFNRVTENSHDSTIPEFSGVLTRLELSLVPGQ